jgi:hypothetical protein
MPLPLFTAGYSLYQTSQYYHSTAAFAGSANKHHIVPQQPFPVRGGTIRACYSGDLAGIYCNQMLWTGIVNGWWRAGDCMQGVAWPITDGYCSPGTVALWTVP